MGVKGAGAHSQMIPRAALRNHIRQGIKIKRELLSGLGNPPSYGENGARNLGQDSKKTIGTNTTASQRGLCSDTASSTTGAFADTFAWFLVAKMLREFDHTLLPSAAVPFDPSPRPKLGGQEAPVVLICSPWL